MRGSVGVCLLVWMHFFLWCLVAVARLVFCQRREGRPIWVNGICPTMEWLGAIVDVYRGCSTQALTRAQKVKSRVEEKFENVISNDITD